MAPHRPSLLVLAACGSALITHAGCGGPAEPGDVPLTLENIFTQGAGAGRAAISPDGRWVAVGGRGPQGAEIHLVPLGAVTPRPTPGQPGLWLAGDEPTWAPDARRLAFTRGADLLVAEPGSAEARPVATGFAGLRTPAWSPDGASLAFYSTGSGHQDIWVAPADGSRPARQLTREAAEADDTRFAPSWSPDGRHIAFVSNAADWWHDDVWVVDVETGGARRLSGSLMAASTPVWSPDGRSIALMGTAKDQYWYQDLAHLYRIDLEVGQSGVRALRESPIEMQVYASDFIMRFEPFWSEDGARLYFPYHERGAFDLWSVPAGGGVATRVTHVGGAWSSLHATPDGSRAVIVRDAPGEGREAWLVDTFGGLPRRLTAFAPRFADIQRPIEISFPSFDGLFIQGFLYLPPAVRAARDAGRGGSEWAPGLPVAPRYAGPVCPALVQVHGGGTNSFYQGTNPIEQYLAARGFVVLAINYRGGSGFGRAFQDLSVEDWLDDQSRDPGGAADWLRGQPWVNGKVGIYGGSYGGMQSMSAITRTPDKFDAAVPMRGIYSEARTLPDADRLGKIFTITGHGGTPEQRPEIYEKTETLARMDRITAPVLIMHGERDVRAPFRNFELAVERLEALGKEFESKTYPEGHGFRDPANSIDMYGRLEAFFRRHLGTCAEGRPAATREGEPSP